MRMLGWRLFVWASPLLVRARQVPWWRVLSWASAGVGLALLLLACVLFLPRLLVEYDLGAGGQFTSAAERVKAIHDVRTTLLQSIAGLILLGGAYLTWRQFLLSREGQITHRFHKT